MSCSSACRCHSSNAGGGVRVSAVILDLDGTLLDTENGTKGVLEEFLAKYYGISTSLVENNKRLGKTLKESAISIVQDYNLPLSPDEFIEKITPLYRNKWLQTKPLPGADRLIKHLHKHKVPFALASNSLRDYIDCKIANQDGWKERFSLILGSDDVQSGKPAPDLFTEAAKRMGVDSTQCLVIEDSLVGVQAAKAANMKVLAIPSQQETDCTSLADAVIKSLIEFQPQEWGLPPFDNCGESSEPVNTVRPCCQSINNGITLENDRADPGLLG